MISLRNAVVNKSGPIFASLQVAHSERTEAEKKGKIWPSFFTIISLRNTVLNKSGLFFISLQVARSEIEAEKSLAEFLYYDFAMQHSSKQKWSFLCFITSGAQ